MERNYKLLSLGHCGNVVLPTNKIVLSVLLHSLKMRI